MAGLGINVSKERGFGNVGEIQMAQNWVHFGELVSTVLGIQSS